MNGWRGARGARRMFRPRRIATLASSSISQFTRGTSTVAGDAFAVPFVACFAFMILMPLHSTSLPQSESLIRATKRWSHNSLRYNLFLFN